MYQQLPGWSKAVKSAVNDTAEVEQSAVSTCGRHCSRKITKTRFERSVWWGFLNDWCLLESRRKLRQQAFQALMSPRVWRGYHWVLSLFAYTYDKDRRRDRCWSQYPAFPTQRSQGYLNPGRIDRKSPSTWSLGWTVNLTGGKEYPVWLRGIFEITEFDYSEQ